MRPSLLTWLCTSLSAGLPRWNFLALLSLSCFMHIWHRFLGCQSLLCEAFHALFLFHSSSSVVGSRSATTYLATELRSARGRASVCSGPCCESSSGPSVVTFALLEPRQFSPQPRSLHETSSRRRVSRMSEFHLGHFCYRTRDANFCGFFAL